MQISHFSALLVSSDDSLIWKILQIPVIFADSPSMSLVFHILLSISLKEKEEEEEKDKTKKKSSVILNGEKKGITMELMQ